MATNKINPIYNDLKRNLKYSIQYIENPDKTKEKELVSGYKCDINSADLDFMEVRNKFKTRTKVIARHWKQNFDPKDNITPEMAHEIGIKTAMELLKGEHQFVIATHVDRQHIHNHIIFNNVNFVTGKGYISNKRTYKKIREISDKFCMEYGLNVVGYKKIEEQKLDLDDNKNSNFKKKSHYIPKDKTKNKTYGKGYKEYQEYKEGNSWKAKLQYAIDKSIREAVSFEQFLFKMRAMGYVVDPEKKHIRFKAPGQKRYTRSKTIGEDYTEDRIRERIDENIRARATNFKYKGNKEIDDIIDIKKSQKAQTFDGYKKWAELHNVKTIADSLRVMNKYDFKTQSDLIYAIKNKNIIINDNVDKLTDVQKQIRAYVEVGKNIEYYKAHYKDKKQSKEFIEVKKSLELIYGKDFSIEDLDENKLKSVLDNLKKSKTDLLNKIKEEKINLEDLNHLKSNFDKFMGWDKENSKEKEL